VTEPISTSAGIWLSNSGSIGTSPTLLPVMSTAPFDGTRVRKNGAGPDEATPRVTYPRLLKATGACPPEDVGRARGYEEFLEALADPDHEQKAP